MIALKSSHPYQNANFQYFKELLAEYEKIEITILPGISFWKWLVSQVQEAQAQRDIFEYIEVFYNRERLHSSLGYYSPEEYETLMLTKMS